MFYRYLVSHSVWYICYMVLKARANNDKEKANISTQHRELYPKMGKMSSQNAKLGSKADEHVPRLFYLCQKDK